MVSKSVHDQLIIEPINVMSNYCANEKKSNDE